MESRKPTLDDLRIRRDSGRETWLGGRLAAAGIAAIALLLLLLAGWWLFRSRAIPVRTVAAKEAAGAARDRTVLNASGYVTARRQATVSSKVTGKVSEVLIEEGMKVKQGQILARLDDSNVKANLDVALAQWAAAKAKVEEVQAQLKQANLEYQRAGELAKQNVVSSSELDRAEADAKSLRAQLLLTERDVTVAERQVGLWRQQLDDTVIRAPFDGVVTTKDAQPGEMISPVSAGGGYTRTGIGTVVDMDSLEIEIDVNESYINRVQSGQPVVATLDAYPDWKIPCRVTAIVPTADRQKSTVKVRVGFEKLDPRILPEMSVKVAFREEGSGGTGGAVVVPREAICRRDGQSVVFVVHDGRVERRAVSMENAQSEDAALVLGVVPGERVVVQPASGLTDGARVKEDE